MNQAGSFRVLHVDDDPQFGELVGSFLERTDDRFDVETARSATEGLERLSEATFDCVVSDYDMPDCDGLEFLERVREEFPDLPFILFTGKGSEEVASQAISAGVTDYLQKQTGTEQYELLANRIRNAIDRYRARRELEERESHLRQAQLVANIGSWHTDVQADEIHWSPEIHDLFGVDPAEYGGTVDHEQFLEFVHPDDREFVDDAWRSALAGEGYDVEHRIVVDGEVKWIREKAELEFAEDGTPLTAIGIVQDITDHKERERDYELLRTLLDHVSEASYVIDSMTGEVLDVNEAACQLLGYDREDLLAMSVPDLNPNMDADSWDAFAADVRDRGKKSLDGVHRRADGSTIPVEINVSHVSLDRDYHVTTVRERDAGEGSDGEE